MGACYPGVSSSVVHDEFDILGMRRTSNANIIWDIGQGESGERYVYIENRSAVPITGLSATFENIPEECDFSYALPDNIPGQSRVLLTMYAEAVGVTEQTDAVAIVVSEQRGTVSIAYDGQVINDVTREFFDRKINEFFPGSIK